MESHCYDFRFLFLQFVRCYSKCLKLKLLVVSFWTFFQLVCKLFLALYINFTGTAKLQKYSYFILPQKEIYLNQNGYSWKILYIFISNYGTYGICRLLRKILSCFNNNKHNILLKPKLIGYNEVFWGDYATLRSSARAFFYRIFYLLSTVF